MHIQIGNSEKFDLRTEQIPLQAQGSFSLLFMSDFHFNRFSKNRAKKLAQEILNLKPDVLALGGDYGDGPGALIAIECFLQELKSIAHKVFILGNHDRLVGFSKLKTLFLKHGFIDLSGPCRKLTINGVGLNFYSQYPRDKQQVHGLSVLLTHKPLDLPKDSQFDLALAGHLHGGQCVLWQKKGKLYPAAWFYKSNFLQQQVGKTKYLISKGLGDSLPLRFNCPRDAILINFKGSP